jgi:hypothetical protein
MELPYNILARLYKIQAKSGSEAKMIQYLESLLPLLGEGITVVNDKNNLYVTKGQADTYPCIVAHTDQVQAINKNTDVLRMDNLFVGFDFHKKQQVGLGADDKNGIFMVILALIHFPVLKACLFHGEETGCLGSTTCDLDFFNDCRYVLQCDRKGGNDFISKGAGVELTSDEFIQDCQLDLFDYKVTDGLITDVVTLKQRGLKVACCNISCGYYNPHTDYESSKISDIERCWSLTKHILSLENTYKHIYAPKIVKAIKAPKMMVKNVTKSKKLQEAYAKRIINKNLGLSDSDLVSLWIEHRSKFPSISLIQFKRLYNEKNSIKIS